MKLTSIQFTLIIVALLLVAGSSYKLGQEAAPTKVIVIRADVPHPVKRSTTEFVYTMSGNIYSHTDPNCDYNEGVKTSPEHHPCPKCRN